MPIFLRTGTPGAGKTCNTIVEVKQRAEKEKRPVFYWNIHLTAEGRKLLPWVELTDPLDYPALPAGAIVIIDEAQDVFRPRHYAKEVPEHVKFLEKHRHKGFDLYIITQQPSLVEKNVRALVGQHTHFVRIFGTETVKKHEWGEVHEDTQSRGDSISTVVRLPREAFAWYKSAEVHTVKPKIPVRFYVLIMSPVLIIGLLLGIGYWVYSKTGADPSGKAAAPGSSTGASSPGQKPAKKEKLTAVEYVEAHQPRIPGLAYTAPIYDGVTAPVEAPFPDACVAMGSTCRCYTGQATVLDLPDALCRRIVERGFFKAFAAKRQPERPSIASQPKQQSTMDFPRPDAQPPERPYPTFIGDS